MTEPVIIGDATLYLGDCREIMPKLGRVDAVVTDPPYGVGLTKKSNDFRGRHFDNGASLQASELYQDDFETVEHLVQDVMPIVLAISQRALVFPGNRMMFSYPRPVSVGTVYVPKAAGQDPWGFGCNNPILYYGKCPYLATGRGSRPNSFWSNQPGEPGVDHPCPKSLEWMLWAVNRASLEGEIICDPFMGSGTTGIACCHLGRQFIGIEISPKHFDTACKRIEEAQRQGRLFDPPRPQLVQQQLFGGER